QSRRETDEEAHRGGQQHGGGGERPAARREGQAYRRPHQRYDQPHDDDHSGRTRLVGDVLRDRLVRRVQRPRQPEVELALADPAVQVPGVPGDGELVHQHQGEEVAGEIGPRVARDLSVPRDPPPDAERHGGLGHAPQQPQHDGGAVLQVNEPRVAYQGRVAPQPEGSTAHGSSSSMPPANAARITSSIGGSSIDRSATGSAASSRALVVAASSRGTSSTALGNRNSFTSPNAASCSAVTPSASMSSIRLV